MKMKTPVEMMKLLIKRTRILPSCSIVYGQLKSNFMKKLISKLLVGIFSLGLCLNLSAEEWKSYKFKIAFESVNKTSYAPTPIFRPRIGFFKVEPAMSQFRVMTALRPSVPDAVTECSPSPKGRPVGPRAQRSNGISSLAFISCLLHIQIPLRVSRCPAPNVSSRCCSSQNISPTLGAMRARRRNLLGTRSRTSPSTTAAQ